jgi:hypothetical protein
MSENHVLLANEIYSDLNSFSVSNCIIINRYVHMPCIQERNGVQRERLFMLQLLARNFCDQHTRFIKTTYFVHVVCGV